MESILINTFNKEQFITEVLNMPKNETIILEFSDALAKNIQIFFENINQDVKEIIITKTSQEYDIICIIEFVKYLKQNYSALLQKYQITFENFTHDELFETLSLRNYLLYTSNNNIKAQWQKKILEKEIKKQERNSHLLKYNEYEICTKYQTDNPYSHFDYPKEENQIRFVFHFYIYCDKTKEEAIKLIKNLNTKNSAKIIQIIKDTNNYHDFFEYAIGFSYSKEEIIRTTFYMKFRPQFHTNNNIQTYFKKHYNLSLNINFTKLICHAIDFYSKDQETKLYFLSQEFKESLNNKEIEMVLHGEKSNKCLKLRDGQVIATKYEFEFKDNLLTNTEKQTLKKHNLYTSTTKILAIYIQDKEIKKKVLYDV